MPSRPIAVSVYSLIIFLVLCAGCRADQWQGGINGIEAARDGNKLSLSTAQFTIDCNLSTGLYDINWTNGPSLTALTCAARLADGTDLSASNCPAHDFAATDIAAQSDEQGSGMQITLHHRKGGLELRQNFRLYKNLPYFLTDVEIVSEKTLASNHLEPLVTAGPSAGLQLSDSAHPRVLLVPWDNDSWVHYNEKHDPAKNPDSFEVTAIYDNESRLGVVAGSLDHDIWKTGIEARDIHNARVNRFRVYAGAACPLTRDSQPHGAVTGQTIRSPWIFLGSFDDWRDGLETYGRAQARHSPPLVWTSGVPVGWNSWAAYRMRVDPDHLLASADFLRDNIQNNSFHCQDGTIFINWDSGWLRYTDEQIADAVRHVHANGQKAGIYWTPFGAFGGNLDRIVPGTDGKFHYSDLLLRDAAGKPLPLVDNGHALDPTHPGTLAAIDYQMNRFVAWGFDYVKLDFLNFGAIEGVHFDKQITTGTEAYNLGMRRVIAPLDPAKIGRPFFVSLSIAPLFPSNFGHARRVSCDVFGKIANSQYLLNSETFGWWISGTIYPFNDPDHIVLWSTQENQQTTEAEARTRLNASAIAGTVFIDSDDLTDPTARARAARFLTNPRINALARMGHAFRPVEGASGDTAADVFVLFPAKSTGSGYLAVFNFDPKTAAQKTINLPRAGFAAGITYTVHDLWSDQSTTAADSLTLHLGPAESTILKLDRL